MHTVDDPEMMYSSNDFPLKKEVFDIVGIAMEVHKTLGKGFLEIVYKDALELEFQWVNYIYTREKSFYIDYKGTILKRLYIADFVVFDELLIEVKAQNNIIEENYKQTINYLAVSKLKVGLILNFWENSLTFKRVVLSK